MPDLAPNNGNQHSDWWYAYHAVFDQWTADKKTCHDLNAYANDLALVAGTGGGTAAVATQSVTTKAALKTVGLAALEMVPVYLSSQIIKSWTGHHCQ